MFKGVENEPIYSSVARTKLICVVRWVAKVAEREEMWLEF